MLWDCYVLKSRIKWCIRGVILIARCNVICVNILCTCCVEITFCFLFLFFKKDIYSLAVWWLTQLIT